MRVRDNEQVRERWREWERDCRREHLRKMDAGRPLRKTRPWDKWNFWPKESLSEIRTIVTSIERSPNSVWSRTVTVKVVSQIRRASSAKFIIIIEWSSDHRLMIIIVFFSQIVSKSFVFVSVSVCDHILITKSFGWVSF